MLRKIRRNLNRWLRNPFRKSNKTIEWQPTSPIPRPVSRIRSQSPSQAVSNSYHGNGSSSLLKPILPDLAEWGGLLPAGGPDATHDLIGLLVGTPLQLLTHVHDFIAQQNPDTNSTALLMGATCTPGDEEALASRELEQPYWVRKADRTGTGWVYLDNPPAHRIVSRLIGNIASTGGNGGNQRKALHNLLTDPFTVPDILKFMEEGCRSFLDYAPLGCALFTAQGGGGSDPLHRYAVALLKAKLRVNRHYILYLLPTDDEPLHIPNMRGTLAYELEREASDTLHFLFQQQTAGAHDTDRAMVSGVITLTGASRARLNGGIDPTTKFELIKKTAGTWLTVTPKVVPLPLIPMGKVEMLNGYRHEEHYQASLTEPLGGKRISPIVAAINTMLAEDLYAPHFITIASSLHQSELTDIANGIKRFPLQPGGQVHVFFNPCWPTVSPVTDTAEALVCDFRGGCGVKACLNDFLVENQSTPLTTCFSQADRLALAGKVAERSLPEEIEKELSRILKTNHL